MLGRILILSSIFCTVASFCQNDWTRHDDSCYFFAHLPAEKMAWHEAVQACAFNESHLVIVESQSEHEFIKKHLSEINPEYTEQFWTFGNDIHDDNIWNWGETRNPMINTFWFTGQPDNGGEHCVSYYTGFKFEWNDENCIHNHFYICEITDVVNSGIIG